MKKLLSMLIFFVLASCVVGGAGQKEIITNNPELLGDWEGVGGFLDIKTAKQMGDISLKIHIDENNQITGSIGDAKINGMKLTEANYGYEIRGVLDAKVKEGVDFEKDHLIILLVLPKEQDRFTETIDANFHLKSNFVFDFGMRVGGVYLTKME
ncbi:hypothetical protein [Lutimonas sp.]|uniref:hypothetical protein n=1 Tax=Lutimonas sp. TaxID=1872403 RepID=UPI003D9BB896